MKNKLFQRTTFISLGIIILISIIAITGFLTVFKVNSVMHSETAEIKSVASVIQADGSITPENLATLHFQTGGKLMYLPFKEGDRVIQGQMIASLDTYALQRQLAGALNTYGSTRNTFDQTQQNTQDNVLQNQQKPLTAGATMDQNNAINDAVKRIVDQNQANLDNSVVQVELANYALQLATVTSPIDGVITHMDVTTPLINVTPATSFTIADPSSLVFRANVLENDIDFVSVGSAVTIKLDSTNANTITATVSKIYPDKITLSTGQKAYQVDIESSEIGKSGIMGQSGIALIQSNQQSAVKLVPTWIVLNHDSLWVLSNGKPVLRSVTIGNTHGNMTEILDGLKANDQLITNPESIAAEKYKIL